MELRLKANVPKLVSGFVQVLIAVAPPAADCAVDRTIGAEALILLAASGIDGLEGGALPVRNHTSTLALPEVSAMIVHETIVQL